MPAQWQDPQATSYVALSLAAMAADGIPPGFNVITGALYEKDTAAGLRQDPVRQVRSATAAFAAASTRAANVLPTAARAAHQMRRGPAISDRCRSRSHVENRSLIQRLIARPEFGPFVLLVVELVVFWAINHDFLSPLNISNTLAFTVELGLIALAMTLLMTSGEFDLSVGSVFGFSPVLMWTLFNSGVTSLEVGLRRRPAGRRPDRPRQRLVRHPAEDPVLPGDARHAAGGARHRAVRHRRLPAAHLERRRPAGSPRCWSATSIIGPFRIYMSLFWFIAAAIVLGYVLTQTKAGNWIQASGGNAERGAGPRRQCRPHQDRAVHAVRR